MVATSGMRTLTAQLHRARLSYDDFEEASQFISRYDPASDDVIRRGLITAAIVAYGRPFIANRGGNENATSQLSVSPRKLFTLAEQRLHERLLSLRNEVVAHTDYDRKPVKRLKGTAAGLSMSGKPFDLLDESIDIKVFGQMCSALKGHCFNKLLELNKKIVELENAP